MIKQILPVFLVALVLLFAGCTQEEAGTTTTTLETPDTGDSTVEPSEIPVLEENDSVEIGEMI